MTNTQTANHSLPLYWTEQYVAAGHSFDTTRKSALVAAEAELAGYQLRGVTNTYKWAVEKLIEDLHDPAYLLALQTGEPFELAQSQGFPWDRGIWTMAVASTTGTTMAARLAAIGRRNTGSLSSGLHHARRDRGAGFCTINGLACAARSLTFEAKLARKKIVILDFDAHCGGGTNSFLAEDKALHNHVVMVDVSTESYDHYAPAHPSSSLLLPQLWDDKSFQLRPNANAIYLDTIDQALDLVPWDDALVVLYNAGVDSYPELEKATIKERERRVFARAGQHKVPVSFVLAGGYQGGAATMDDIVELHMATIDAANQPTKEKK